MRKTRIKSKQRKRFNRLFSTLVVFCIVLTTLFILKDKLFYPDTVIAGQISEENSNNLNTEEENFNNEADKQEEVKNYPVSIDKAEDILIVVNKDIHVDSDYKPDDLVIPDVKFSFDGEHEKKYMRQEAAKALEELFKNAYEEGKYIFALSGYRSYNTQKYIFNNFADRMGEEEANKLSARPGQSEHQTGLAMDITSQQVGFGLEEEFGNTNEGKWVKDNAHKFGFIIRYPKDKTHITGYLYEPWHLRYVGKDVAQKIYNEQITLEEYFGIE